MGYEIWTKTDISLFGSTIKNKEELLNEIKECEKELSMCKERLRVFVHMTEPNKFYSENIMGELDEDFDNTMESYDYLQKKLIKLEMFKEAWDECHDNSGNSVLPVNPLDLKKTYMGGDFMNYVLEDGSEMPEDYWSVYHGFRELDKYSLIDKIK